MTKLQKIILVIGLTSLALLMHSHHIYYGVALEGHVLKLVPSQGSKANRIREDLKNTLRKKPWSDFSDIPKEQMLAELQVLEERAATAKRNDERVMARLSTGKGHPNDVLVLEILSKIWVAAEENVDTYIQKARTTAEVRRKKAITAAEQAPIYFGLLPVRKSGAAQEKIVREAFWAGVVVPAVLVWAALFLLTTLSKKKQEKAVDPAICEVNPIPHQANPDLSTTDQQRDDSLAKLLLRDLGENFPVSGGNGKEDDPLIVTEKVDYVAIEYAAVRHVMATVREEYELAQQRLMRKGDRNIDEMIFRVKPAGAEDWTGSRRFYFDITAGFNRFGRH